MLANPKIFKAYDIRGEWNKDWDSQFVYQISRAIALSFQPKTIALGQDARLSSPELFHHLSAALLDEGINVKDLGLCGTELTYFSTSFVPDIDLALMITASHNPPQDNGLKITLRNSISLGLDSGLGKLRDLALSPLPLTKNQKKETLTKLNLWPLYQKHVFRLANLAPQALSHQKIVVDAGNSVAGYMFDQVLGCLNLQTIKLFWDLDGRFPNHPPDPFQEKNLEQLKKKVIQEKADLGVAYDGDSDRVFFIDETGRYIPGYYLAALLTNYILHQTPSPEKEIIAHDPRYYWATQDIIARHQAQPVPSQVGHTLIKAKMREVNSLFSAECSGHVFYRENNFAESSMLTTLLVLKLLSQQGPLSQLVNPFFQNYPISGEINFIVDSPQEILIRLEEKYSEGELSKLDGLSLTFPDWRFNVRSSNTQPLLRLNVEAKHSELVSQKVEELKKIIGGKISEH